MQPRRIAVQRTAASKVSPVAQDGGMRAALVRITVVVRKRERRVTDSPLSPNGDSCRSREDVARALTSDSLLECI